MTHGNVGRRSCTDMIEQRPNDTNANGDRPEIRRPKKTFLNCGRTSPTRARSTMMYYYGVLIVENVTVTTVVKRTGRLLYDTPAGRLGYRFRDNAVRKHTRAPPSRHHTPDKPTGAYQPPVTMEPVSSNYPTCWFDVQKLPCRALVLPPRCTRPTKVKGNTRGEESPRLPSYREQARSGGLLAPLQPPSASRSPNLTVRSSRDVAGLSAGGKPTD